MQKIQLKNIDQIQLMRKAGLIAYGAHMEAVKLVMPGVKTCKIDAVVEAYILDNGGSTLFKGVQGKIPFPAATCISINDEIIHGIPSNRQLENGDIVSIDIGCKYMGWCADTAISYGVGQITPEKQRLLTVTKDALHLAIKLISEKRYWSEVIATIEPFILENNFSIVEIAEGHGLGKNLWEPPRVPNYLTNTYKKFNDFPLVAGTVIAVEPMVVLGKKDAFVGKDGWVVKTKDKSPAAHFEHSLAIMDDKVIVLTASPIEEEWSL